MRAAALLRLTELRRRGGLALLAAAAAAVFVAGLSGYGLASDLAVTLGYAGAIFLGAFPPAIDRERRRSHLALASPASPWGWALGSALGVGLGSLLATFVLFAAAALGGAAGGGVPTHEVYPLNDKGTIWIAAERRIGLPDDARALRTQVRAYAAGGAERDAPTAVPLLVDGAERTVPTDQIVILPATPPAIRLGNPTAEVVVGIAGDRTGALGTGRSFLWNAILAGLAPALAAMGLAALGSAAGASLSAPVAALLAATLLLAASLKGFLLEAWEHEGKVAAAVAEEEHAHEGHDHHDHDGHHHGPVAQAPPPVRAALRGLFGILPDLPALDASDRVARGDWTGAGIRWHPDAAYLPVGGRLLDAARLAALGLLCAAALGGIGMRFRRTP
jgi:hypothetical protein